MKILSSPFRSVFWLLVFSVVFAQGCNRCGKAGQPTAGDSSESGNSESASSGSAVEEPPLPPPPNPLRGPVLTEADALTEEDVNNFLTVRKRAAEIAAKDKNVEYPLADALKELGQDLQKHQRVSLLIRQTMENQVRRRMTVFARQAMAEQRRQVAARAAEARDPEARKMAESELKAVDEGLQRVDSQIPAPGSIEEKNVEILKAHEEDFAELRRMQQGNDNSAMPGMDAMPSIPPAPPGGDMPLAPPVIGPNGKPTAPFPPGQGPRMPGR